MNEKAVSTIRLPRAIEAWGRADFTETLAREIEGLDSGRLPLQQGLTTSSHVADSGFRLMILTVAEADRVARIRAGVFYAGVVAGCSCADDPTPVSENPEYCEIDIALGLRTAEAVITLCRDESSPS